MPAIRFAGFDGEWEDKELDQILSIGSSKRVHREDYVSSGVPFFRGLEISKLGKSAIIEDVLYISKESYLLLKERFGVPQIGDILITAVGTLGNSFLVNNSEPFYFKDGNLIWLSNIKINNQYLNVYIGNGIGQQRILNSAAGSNQKALTMVNLKNVRVIFPNKKEQTKIGNYFQQLDTLIAQHQQKHDKLQNIKKALLEKCFPKQGEHTPELRFKGFSGAWEEKALGDVGATYTGLSGKTKDDFGKGRAKFVTYMNVFSNIVSNQDLLEPIEIDNTQNEVKYGDVFFSTSSETPEEVGMSSVWMSNIDNVYLNSFCFGFRPSQKLDNYFLAYMLRSNFFRKQIVFLAQGISRYNISKNKAMNIRIKVPLMKEQTKIGNLFQQLDTLINQQQTQLSKLKNIKQACLEKMFV